MQIPPMLKFKIGYTYIEIHFSFLAIIAILMSLGEKEILVLSIIAAIFHEMGHLLFMYLFKAKIDNIIFYAAGIKIRYKDGEKMKTYKEILIILGGIFINLILAGILYTVVDKPFILSDFMLVNFSLAIFNLVPVKFFDGGRLLKLFYKKITHSDFKTAMIENTISCIFIISILILAFLLRITNISLYVTLLYFLFAVFIM